MMIGHPGKTIETKIENVISQTEYVVNGKKEREPAVQMDFEKRRKELLDYLEEERSKEQSKLSKQSKGLGKKKRGYEIQRRRRVKRKNLDMESPRERQIIHQKTAEMGKRISGKSLLSGRGEDSEINQDVWVDEQEQKRELGPWYWLDCGIGLRGEIQKRRGIWFGEWMIRELKKEFNVKFNQFVKQRKKKVDEIRERDLKIKEICGELKLIPPKNEIFHNFLER
jgi:hypothetical protein